MMSEIEAQQRDAVDREVREWLGTNFHNEAEVKCRRDADGNIVDRGAVDCAKLLYRVFHNAGLVPRLKIPHYPPDWHLHRDDERFLDLVRQFAEEIEEGEARHGDVVLYRYGRAWSHGGIVIKPGWPHIIHAVWNVKRVVMDRGDGGAHGDYPRRFFSYWKRAT